MNILAVETASTVCGTALFIDDCLIQIDEIIQPHIHSERLPVIVNNLLSTNSVNITQLDGIAVSSGPGSYTGLRIGMSLAKGLAAAGNIPIVQIPTLLAMNATISQKGTYWILLHSHKNYVFAQRFYSGEPVSEIEFDVFNPGKYIPLYGFNLEILNSSLHYTPALPSSKFVGELALQFFDDWAETDLNQIIPNYITNFNLGEVKTK